MRFQRIEKYNQITDKSSFFHSKNELSINVSQFLPFKKKPDEYKKYSYPSGF
jgi:hypothetical protein